MNVMTKSLSQLERLDWGKPPIGAPQSLKRCFELRHKKLEELNVEDLRLLIGQDIGLEFLMPIAIETLEKNPLVNGQHYCGDLLVNVLRVNSNFYRSNPILKQRVNDILQSLPKALEKLDPIDFDCTSEAVSEALEQFNEISAK